MSMNNTSGMALLGIFEAIKSSGGVVKNEPQLHEKLTNMIQDGADKFQVISDWDESLTKYEHDGRNVLSCCEVVEVSEVLSESFRKQCEELRNYYHQFEFSKTMSRTDKLPHMVQWRERFHEALLKEKLTSDKFLRIVSESGVELRDGFEEFMRMLSGKAIPLTLFSAGITDFIEQILKLKFGEIAPNIHILSNRLEFTTDGLLTGFSGVMVTSNNKIEAATQLADSFFRTLSSRSNVLLIGDTLTDSYMARGLPNVKNNVKIGYVNRNVDENMNDFLEFYDIVLPLNHTVDVANTITAAIIN